MTEQNKRPEQYRQLADKFREIARSASAENERADLLASAEIWDLIATRLKRPPPVERFLPSKADPSGAANIWIEKLFAQACESQTDQLTLRFGRTGWATDSGLSLQLWPLTCNET